MDEYSALLLCIFFLISSFLSPCLCQSDNTECTAVPFRCGRDSQNISFPFWGDSVRPLRCGHPGFELRCVANDHFVITIDEVDHRVLSINQQSYSMRLARSDLWSDLCSPKMRNSSTLESPLFAYPTNVGNLTLAYDCPDFDEGRLDSYPKKLPCPKVGDLRDLYFNDTFLDSVSDEVRERCSRGILKVPVDRSALDQIERWSEDVVDGLRKGFQVNYTNVMLCELCNAGHGACRFDSSANFHCSFPRHGNKKKIKIIIGISAGIGGILLMCVVFFLHQWYKKKRYSAVLSRNISSDMSSAKDVEKSGSTYLGVPVFTYEELIESTNNFDSSKELGDGGFGTVYKGKLKDGRVVAVKRLYENNFKRVEQFMNEIKILEQVRHHNLVSLYGCTSSNCRELLLVYEFVPNGTVSDHLHGNRSKPDGLPWPTRLSIAIETACALSYLHHKDIIHRDVKTNNILLDKNFTVKVADFGLSRLFPTQATHVSTAPQGTPGYVDPDYHQCYQLTSKSDVFSFGVVLMELVTAKTAVDITRHRHDINLSTMAINRIQNCTLHEIVDPTLRFGVDPAATKMITAVAELAFQCLQSDKDMRPSMEDVWEELKAIESRDYGPEKTEKVVTSADDAVLLENGVLSLSPESVSVSWSSSSRNTTPNASN